MEEQTMDHEAYVAYRKWLDTASARESANAGTLRDALFRTTLLRQGKRTRSDFDDAIAMLQEQLDECIYYGWVESNPQERFEALVRIWATWGSAYDPERTYQDFLDSTYWKVIAAYMKWLRGGHCQMCDSDSNLHTHHKIYTHKGSEHKHLEDLVVVCAKCHTNHHGR